MFKSNHAKIAVLLGIVVFVVDAISKYLVVSHIPLAVNSRFVYPYGGIAVFQNFLGIEFSINHVINHGAAWGMFREYHEILLLLRILLVAGIVIFLLFYNQNKEWEIPFALIIAGALGNIVDVYVYGHVVDMFHFIFWGFDYPVFNVADSAIFIGICWLVIGSWSPKFTKATKQ